MPATNDDYASAEVEGADEVTTFDAQGGSADDESDSASLLGTSTISIVLIALVVVFN